MKGKIRIIVDVLLHHKNKAKTEQDNQCGIDVEYVCFETYSVKVTLVPRSKFTQINKYLSLDKTWALDYILSIRLYSFKIVCTIVRP